MTQNTFAVLSYDWSVEAPNSFEVWFWAVPYDTDRRSYTGNITRVFQVLDDMKNLDGVAVFPKCVANAIKRSRPRWSVVVDVSLGLDKAKEALKDTMIAGVRRDHTRFCQKNAYHRLPAGQEISVAVINPRPDRMGGDFGTSISTHQGR